MASIVRKRFPWIPGVWADFPLYNCLHYYSCFGDDLLNSEYAMVPWGDLKRRIDDIAYTFGWAVGIKRKVFIRPDSSFKTFGGKVVNTEKWTEESQYLCYNNVPILPETLTIVAPVQEIRAEYRFVVVKGQVVAGCRYMLKDEISHGPVDFRLFTDAQDIVDRAKYSPEPAWILDLAEGNFDSPKVVEVNAFSTSGLYCCPMEQIVEAVSKAALEEWSEYQ